jgi:hypothetical protein
VSRSVAVTGLITRNWVNVPRLEMVTSNVAGDRFYVPHNGFGMPDCKCKQSTTVVRTQFHVCLSDEAVNHLGPAVTPMPRNADD